MAMPTELAATRTCTGCAVPAPAHEVIDEDGASALCSLCLMAFVGGADRQAVTLTLMVNTTARR